MVKTADLDLEKQLTSYQKDYDGNALLVKLRRYAAKLGVHAVFQILNLYYLVAGKKVPLRIRMLVIAALGYFILPADLISDFIPVFGFSDDLSFLTYAFTQAVNYITPEIKQKSGVTLKKWFPKLTDEIKWDSEFPTNQKE